MQDTILELSWPKNLKIDSQVHLMNGFLRKKRNHYRR